MARETDLVVDDTCWEPQPVPAPSKRLVVRREGRSITRQIPKPVALIDTREQDPLDFDNLCNWIGESRRQKLPAGDYSVEGMEKLLVMERKSLPDLIRSLIHERKRFFRLCEKLSKYRWRALLVEASYRELKTPYEGDWTTAHPNAVCGTLDALEAKFGIPVIYSSSNRELAQEKAASWLSKHFTYWYLEEQGLGRVLQEGDL